MLMKFTREPATKALDGSGWSTPRPGHLTPGKDTRYPLHRRLGESQGRSGPKLSPPTGIRSPDLPARTESLFRLVMLMLNVFTSLAFPH